METRKLKRDNEISLLRSLRVGRGLSQRKLAEKAGISRGRLYRLEAGGFDTATYEELLRISEALGVGVEELLRASGSSNGALQNGHQRDLFHLEGKRGQFRIVSLIPPRADLFVGKLILSANGELSSSEVPAARTVFLQALMGYLRVVVDGKNHELREGEHLSLSGHASYTILNPSVREQVSLLITSPAPAF